MTALNNVSSIDKVFGDRAPGYETSLVRVDKERYQNHKSKGETLGMDFETIVLEGDRAKRVRAIGALFLWEEDNVGFIDGV
jgi:hypothetical protein